MKTTAADRSAARLTRPPPGHRSNSLRRLAAVLALCGSALPLVGCLFDSNDDRSTAPEKIAFKAPTLVSQPTALASDPGSGRCPDPSMTCFKNNKDVMSGRHQLFRVDDFGLFVHTQGLAIDDDGELIKVDKLEGYALLSEDSFVNTQQATDLSYGDVHVAPNNGLPFDPRTAAVAGRLTPESRDRSVIATWEGSLLSLKLGGAAFEGVATRATATDSSDLFLAVADFNGDAVQEVAVDAGRELSVWSVATAADGTPQKWVAGPSLPLPISPSSVVTGDFFGTGNMIATVSSSPANPATTPRIDFYSVDPKTLAIAHAKTLDLILGAGTGTLLPTSAALAAGRFNSAQSDQLAVVVNALLADGSSSVALFSVGADDQGNPVQRATVPNFTSGLLGSALRIRSGRLTATAGLDAIALTTDSAATNKGHIVLATFDISLNPTLELDSPLGNVCIRDMQLGNFDRQQADPTRPNQGFFIRNADLQIAYAVSYPDCSNQNLAIAVQSIDFDVQQAAGKRYTVEAALPVVPGPGYTQSYPLADVHLVPYDRQGRSMVLGTPSLVTIENQAQVTVALGAPPMHVDVFGGKVINLSAAPGGFSASFESGSDEKVSNSSSWSATYSFAAEESLSTQLTFGDCDLGDCASLADKFSAKQAVDGSSTQLGGSFTQQTTDLSEQTGFSDLIHYKSSALTVYVYPVLGKTVCPAALPGCTSAQKVPLTVMVAGPDTTVETHVDGNQIAWYQPPWMVGNLLSYPGALAQLRAAAWNDPTTFAPLSDPVRWQTDSSTAVVHTRWTAGGNTGTATELNQNYSFENDLSASVQASFDDVVTGSVSQSFDVSGSFGFKRLTDTTSETSNSTGIGFTKMAAFADPARYAYWVTPHIFGQTPPPGAGGDQAPSTNRQVWGALRSSYVVDPLSAGAGSIWRQQYTLPDIALNHPQRWRVETASADRGNGSCLVFDRSSSDVQCAVLGDRDPDNPWTDEYHHMRGFFIGQASANGTGPQLTVATAGDPLLLQVRVHNFSLAPMPAGSKVRVRVYGTEWDTSTNRRVGKSFVVGTGTSLGAVPPFNTDTDQPNWVLVGLPFDTTAYADKDIAFGAVVWMEDSGGKLVPEMDDKGLTAIPDPSIDLADLDGLEQKYGNNHGFYNGILHIDAKQTGAPQAGGTAATRASVVITEAGVERAAVSRSQRTLVGVRVQVGDTDLAGGLSADFYDGDPAAGGRLFSVQTVARLRAGHSYDYRTGYRSDACGGHDLYVVVGRGTRFEHAARVETVTVSCG